MKINIDSPVRQDEIVALLEKQESPKYTYLGHPNNIRTQVQFEVEEDQGRDMIAYTKALIKTLPNGKMIAFRVLEDGKFW